MVSAAAVVGTLLAVGAAAYVTYAVVTAKAAGATAGPVTSPPNVGPGNVQWDPSNSSMNMKISGNTITKSDTFNGWENTGSVSLQQLSGQGYVQLSAATLGSLIADSFPGFTVTRGSIAFGITTSDSIADLSDVDYAFRCNDDGSLDVIENGTPVFEGTWTPGDVLIVHNNNGMVMYHQNGTNIYNSLVALSGPWKAACAIYNSGQAISGMQIQPGMPSVG